jgi:glycosyltransferase involved in cell wall biosynthesis
MLRSASGRLPGAAQVRLFMRSREMVSAASVSCVIPTHDRDGLLPVAVQSVLHQTIEPLEIFVVDDLGRPETREQVTYLAGTTTVPMTYVDCSHAEMKAAGASRNQGAARASGAYLAFLDDDDYWEPEFLEKLLASIVAEQSDFAVSWTSFRRDDRKAPGLSMPAGLTIAGGLDRSGLTGSNSVISTTAFHRIGGFDGSLRVLNDYDYFRRLLRAGLKYSIVPERLITQVSHDLGHLSTRSIARAAIIKGYRDRYALELSPRDRRHLTRLMHASSRGSDQTALKSLGHGVLQGLNTSPAEYFGGIHRRIRTGLGMYR